jgi:hypothetical protein
MNQTDEQMEEVERFAADLWADIDWPSSAATACEEEQYFGSARPDADKWGVDEVDRTLAAAIDVVSGHYQSRSAYARDYARAVVRWPDTMFGPKIGAKIRKFVWVGSYVGETFVIEHLETIARRLNLVRYAPPPEGFFVLTPVPGSLAGGMKPR